MRQIINRGGLAAMVISLLMFIFPSCVTDDEPSAEALIVGDSLPAFSVELNNGKTVSDVSLRGKAVVIVLFNTSCPDCRHELPVVQELYEEFREDPRVEIFAIARAETAPSIEEYWKENGLTIPWSAQEDRKVYELFAKSVIPRIYIADQEGKITSSFDDKDMPDFATLKASLVKIMRELYYGN